MVALYFVHRAACATGESREQGHRCNPLLALLECASRGILCDYIGCQTLLLHDLEHFLRPLGMPARLKSTEQSTIVERILDHALLLGAPWSFTFLKGADQCSVCDNI